MLANGDEILRNLSNNKHRKWHNGIAAAPIVKDMSTACGRFTNNDFFDIEVKPKFRFKKSSTVFTMGSCFARNVAKSLTQQGINVTSKNFALNPNYFTKLGPAQNALIKIPINAMYQGLYFALEGRENIKNGLLEIGDDLFYNIELNKITNLSFKDSLIVRNKVDESIEKVLDSHVAIFTLGLTETWIDVQTGVFFNNPSAKILSKYKNRFKFYNVGIQEAIETLEKIVVLLNEKSNHKQKIVLTISPVPLLSTCMQSDVVTANTYSKSTLRVAADAIATKYDNVDYFPSYEMVMNSPRSITWKVDQRHVQYNIVNKITSRFYDIYFRD